MSELLKLENIGEKGINTDIAPWALPPEFLTTAVNMRIYSGKIQASGGYQSWSTAPVLFNPGHIMHVGALTGNFWAVLGRTAVYSFDGATWTDISSAEGYAAIGTDGELDWTSCELGAIPVFNNPQTHPEYWSPVSGGQILQELPFNETETWDSRGYTCKVMRSHKNFLIALNLQEDIDELPTAYRISTAADINGLPYTWDETDQSGLAIKAQLGGDGGQIIDGLSLRDSFVIYSEQAIDILNFTGGEFVWARRELSNTVGLLSKNSIVEVKGVHYFMGDGDIYSNNGTSIDSILYGRIKEQFSQRVNPDFYNRSCAVRNNRFKEVWFCVPIDGAEYPNWAYIYNWHDQSWAVRELPYEINETVDPAVLVQGMTYAAYGAQTDAEQDWDGWEGVWDSQTGIWGSRKLSPLDDTVVGVIGNTSELLILDPSDAFTSEFSPTKLERTNFPLIDHKQVTTITRIYPHMSGATPVWIQVGSQDFADAPIRWKPAVEFNPGTDRKVDIRTTGELHCWRITSSDNGGLITTGSGNWEISGLDFEFEADGVR